MVSQLLHVKYLCDVLENRTIRVSITGGPHSGWSKKRYSCLNFAIISVNIHHDFNHFFTARTRNIKVRLRLPPHLHSVITLPSKTYTAVPLLDHPVHLFIVFLFIGFDFGFVLEMVSYDIM